MSESTTNLKKQESSSEVSEINQRWFQLQAENKFDIEIARAVTTTLKDQCALAKNLDELWTNKDLLPSIQSEIKYSGEATAVLKMIKLLNPINMIAVGNNALGNESGMQYAAEMIVGDESLKKWKMVEFRNMVNMAIKGEFGVVYNRVDVGVLYEWIAKYDVIRCNKIADERAKEQKQREDDLMNMDKSVAQELLKGFKKVAGNNITKEYSSPKEFLSENGMVADQFADEYKHLEEVEKAWYEKRGGLLTYKMERAVMVMKEVNGLK